jgi:hypothetical protein
MIQREMSPRGRCVGRAVSCFDLAAVADTAVADVQPSAWCRLSISLDREYCAPFRHQNAISGIS